jgi:phosphopantetheine--protein transferase-like protein|tara:strand:+ start:1125 stop:1478 length:354 start_codon:yes stop_codon:yes gene_type:complete
MIENFGIGIDVSSIKKFKDKPFKQNETFYRKIFSDNEINYCLKFKNYYEKFAGKFALKEALIKSIHKKITFSEIEISYLDSKPIVKILNSEINYQLLASLSHENGIAVAVVISEKIK